MKKLSWLIQGARSAVRGSALFAASGARACRGPVLLEILAASCRQRGGWRGASGRSQPGGASVPRGAQRRRGPSVMCCVLKSFSVSSSNSPLRFDRELCCALALSLRAAPCWARKLDVAEFVIHRQMSSQDEFTRSRRRSSTVWSSLGCGERRSRCCCSSRRAAATELRGGVCAPDEPPQLPQPSSSEPPPPSPSPLGESRGGNPSGLPCGSE